MSSISSAQKRTDVVLKQVAPTSRSSSPVRNTPSTTSLSIFSDVPMAPADPILGMRTLYLADKADASQKVNVAIGAYRDDDNKPVVLPCIRAAEKIIIDRQMDKEYLPQRGNDTFSSLSREVILGKDSIAIADGRVVTVQSLSGSGSLRLIASFLKTYAPGRKVFYSAPTWATHATICAAEGITTGTYRYWDAVNKCLDYEGMCADLSAAPRGSVILLHACAHNPTGVDPTKEQWKGIAKVMRENGLLPWFDSAYQGFASGSLEEDAWAIRFFERAGFEMFLCQSFAKNFGLYGERAGTASVILAPGASRELASRVLSQIEVLIRNFYSSPPLHGARIVQVVLSDPQLTASWHESMLEMSGRIKRMRHLLKERLDALGTPGTWDHITSQIGMFSYTGLSPAQCELMITKHHIFLLKSGRISMAGVTSKNVDQIARAIDDAVRNVK